MGISKARGITVGYPELPEVAEPVVAEGSEVEGGAGAAGEGPGGPFKRTLKGVSSGGNFGVFVVALEDGAEEGAVEGASVAAWDVCATGGAMGGGPAAASRPRV